MHNAKSSQRALMNPGRLLSKTWASIARLPFSLYIKQVREYKKKEEARTHECLLHPIPTAPKKAEMENRLQKGGVPAAPSGTATLLRLSPNHQFCPRPFLAVTDFRHPRLSWLDGRCVQGPGTYSPRHG